MKYEVTFSHKGNTVTIPTEDWNSANILANILVNAEFTIESIIKK